MQNCIRVFKVDAVGVIESKGVALFDPNFSGSQSGKDLEISWHQYKYDGPRQVDIVASNAALGGIGSRRVGITPCLRKNDFLYLKLYYAMS